MRDQILTVVRSILGDGVDMDTPVAEAPAWDSLKMVQIVMALDEAGVSLPFERIAEIQSVADILEMAEGRL